MNTYGVLKISRQGLLLVSITALLSALMFAFKRTGPPLALSGFFFVVGGLGWAVVTNLESVKELEDARRRNPG